MPSIPRYRPRTGPAILSAGFRPFFLAAAAWSAFAVPLWLAAYLISIDVPTLLPPAAWHFHEMVYGGVRVLRLAAAAPPVSALLRGPARTSRRLVDPTLAPPPDASPFRPAASPFRHVASAPPMSALPAEWMLLKGRVPGRMRTGMKLAQRAYLRPPATAGKAIAARQGRARSRGWPRVFRRPD